MENARTKNRKWIILAAAAVLVIALAAAVLLLLGGAGLSARYDDVETILEGCDPALSVSSSVGDDGEILLRFTREDVYWYARKYGLMDRVRWDLTRAGVSAGGFRIADGELTVYARCRAPGLFPLSYKAVMDVRWENGLVLSARNVFLGRRIELPRGRWPSFFQDSFVIGADTLSPLLTDAFLEGDSLVLVHAGLRSAAPDTLPVDRSVLTAVQILGVGLDDPDGILSFLLSLPDDTIPMAEAREVYYAAEDPLSAMARLLSLTDPDILPTLWSGADPFTREMLVAPLLRSASELRSALSAGLSAEQAKYEKILSAIRESYKSGGLSLAETGFVSVSTGQPLDPGALTSLSVTATDCRVVLLRSSFGDGEICTGDMPPVSEISRSGKNVMAGRLDEEAVYDLGVALSTSSGIPLLIYRRGDGALILREIGEAVFVSLLVERSNPVVDVDALPIPARSYLRAAGEGWSGAVLLTMHVYSHPQG